ncbi:MAG: hypothetical protein GY946_19445, partial [bacterium]|nr:hypothetical protein [bacterium]
MSGLGDLSRSGRPRSLSARKAKQILRMTVEQIPRESTHWSHRLMAKYAGVVLAAREAFPLPWKLHQRRRTEKRDPSLHPATQRGTCETLPLDQECRIP